MKRIRLYVNGKRYVISECEGAAEIWPESNGSKAQASDEATAVIRVHGDDVYVDLRVEAME